MENVKNDGGPVYPVVTGLDNDVAYYGMMMRDYFAGQALMGILAHEGWCPDSAKMAYSTADAMITAREGV